MNAAQQRQAHVRRLLSPLKPGLAYVLTPAFIRKFEREDADDGAPMPPEELRRARHAARARMRLRKQEMLLYFRLDADRYLLSEEEDAQPGWNASNLDDMRLNIGGYCDAEAGNWERHGLKKYAERNPDALSQAGLAYVGRFISAALQELPDHIGDGDESVYYDTTDEEEEEDDAAAPETHAVVQMEP